MAGRVYFLDPHQDDGVLFMAQVAAHHVLAGREVHVVLMTNGSTSSALAEINGTATDPTWWGTPDHDPAAEGYTPLTPAGFGLARTREWRQSWRHLGVPPERQQFGEGWLAQSDGLPNNISVAYATGVIETLAAAEAAAGRDKPGFYTMHWEDPQPDHAAVGTALRNLRLADPAFSDARWLVKPEEAADAGAVPYTVPATMLTEVVRRQKHAAWAYGAWAPEQGAYAIGMHSVASYFNGGPLAGAVNYTGRNPG